MYKTGKYIYEPFNKETLRDRVINFIKEHKKGLAIALTITAIETGAFLYANYAHNKDMQKAKPYINALERAAEQGGDLKENYLKELKN